MSNRIIKCAAMLAILCVLVTALAAPAFAATYSKVYGQTQDRLRLRASASTSAAVIDNIVNGACVYVTNSTTSGGLTFIKVNYRNSSGSVDTGWLCQSDGSKTYVKILSAEQAKNTFSVSGGDLPSRNVGTFTAAQRSSAAATATTSGSSSADTIKSVQSMLKDLGYYTGEITGNVGTKTKTAIKNFQSAYNLTVDGVAGPNTIAKLESVYGSAVGKSSSSSGTSLKLGSTGTKVRDLQLDLTTLGYYWAEITGNFGAKTQAAVKLFQQRNNLTADGVAGTKTLNAIASAVARKGGTSATSTTGTTLKLNSQGTAVSNLQTDLKQLGYYYAEITGNFGTKTEAAVKSFQSAKGLTADGIAGAKTLSAVSTAIAAAGGSVSDSTSGTLKLGSTGSKVTALQTDLTALGYYYGDITGHFGSLTQTAVKKFQQAKGLTQDGIVGTATLSAISSALNGSGALAGSGTVSGGSLREGDSGSAVLELQTMLQELGIYYGSLTGNFGSLTKQAVRKFQDDYGLTVDGIAGTQTMNKLRALTGNTSSVTGTGATVSEANSYGRINKDNVYLRTSYSTTSAAKASLDAGKLLRITKSYTVAGVKWYYVTVEVGSVTHKGYVRADMVTLIDADDYASGGGLDLDIGDKEIRGMIRVTGTSVNLREGPGTTYDKVGTATKGEVFYYVDMEASWYQTKAGYWIKNDYVEELSASEAEDYISDTYDGSTYRYGSTGSMVSWIQEALDELGFYGGEVTGHYGNKTKQAVMDFQKSVGLSADGVCGPKTMAELFDAVSGDYSDGAYVGSGKYNPTIYKLHWFDNKSVYTAANRLRAGNTATVYDISKGYAFKIKIQSAGNHADVEPLTSSDTKVLCSLYNVINADLLVSQNKYQRRAVVVECADGTQFLGSMYAIPHGTDTVSGNDFDGQFCIHFYQSKTHETDRVDNDDGGHQELIATGEKALESLKDSNGNQLINVKETYP